MKVRFLALAIFMLACVPAFAVNVSTCQTITSGGYYELTNNLSTSSTACLEITSLPNSVGVEINCNGYSITMTGSAALYPIYTHDNALAVVWWHNCTINSYTGGSPAYGTNIPYYVLAKDNYGYDPARNGMGASTWSSSNVYNGGKLAAVNTQYMTSISDTFNDSSILCNQSDYCYVSGASIDNSGHSASSGDYGGAIYILQSNYPTITYSSITGYPGAQGTGNIDDGVLLMCEATAGASAPTITCTDAYVDHVTTTDMWDAGIEFVGRWSNVTVTNGTHVRPRLAGIAGWTTWAVSLNNALIDSNTVTAGTSNTYLISLTAHSVYGNSAYGGFFTGNTFSNNSIDINNGSSHIGQSAWQWDNVSGNTITNNHFGSSATLYVQGTYGFTDGGGNYCGSATSVVTCH